MCNLNVILVLEFISRDLYLLFDILLSSKFQNSIFYQHMRPKSDLKFPRPFREKHTPSYKQLFDEKKIWSPDRKKKKKKKKEKKKYIYATDNYVTPPSLILLICFS